LVGANSSGSSPNLQFSIGLWSYQPQFNHRLCRPLKNDCYSFVVTKCHHALY
jgi:hypothetical protein